jgi:hypothetical protein
MSGLYVMQRANGDWFALDDHGHLRVPVFHSSKEAMVARSRDWGMECFRPVALDERAIQDLKTADGNAACFWLVKDPSRNLKRGRPLALAQFALLVRDSMEKPGMRFE